VDWESYFEQEGVEKAEKRSNGRLPSASSVTSVFSVVKTAASFVTTEDTESTEEDSNEA